MANVFESFKFVPYIGPQGDVEAAQVGEDVAFPSGAAKKGEWLVRRKDGTVVISDAAYFHATFRQRYPRPVDEDRQSVCLPGPKGAA